MSTQKQDSLMISEVWELMRKCETPQDLFDLIRKQNSKSLELILRAHFMDKTMFKIQQIPSYVRNTAPEGLAETNLRIEADRLYGILFGNNTTNDVRRTILLASVLSGIDKSDAYLVEHIIESEPGSDFNHISPALKDWVIRHTKKHIPSNM